MEMKHLKFLHIIYSDVTISNLPRRPNFKFYVSCCSKFKEWRAKNSFSI